MNHSQLCHCNVDLWSIAVAFLSAQYSTAVGTCKHMVGANLLTEALRAADQRQPQHVFQPLVDAKMHTATLTLTYIHSHTQAAQTNVLYIPIISRGPFHTLKGSMPGGVTPLDDVKELGSNPLTVLRAHVSHQRSMMEEAEEQIWLTDLRFVEVGGVQRVRELGGVAVDEFAVVC